MNGLLKAFIATAFGAGALGLAAANAYKPDFCDIDHDHRSHHTSYYDFYDHDRYYRAGPYRPSAVSFSFRFHDGYSKRGGYYNRDRYYDRGYYNDAHYRRSRFDRRNGYRGRRSRVLNREIFDTRHHAKIVLREEVVYSRKGPRLICSVFPRGPEADYVSERRIHRIAKRGCSPKARIRYHA